MKTLKELRDQMNGARTEFQALDKLCETEARGYTPEETTKVNGLIEQIKTITAQIAQVEADEKAAQAARDQARVVMTTSPSASIPNDFAPAAKIEVGEPGWKADPKKGYKSHQAFLLEILDVTRNGKKPSAQLSYLALDPRATVGTDEQSTYSNPHGGFTIPEAYSPTVATSASEGDVLFPYTTKIPMEQPVVNMNARTDKNHSSSVSGGLTVSRRAEADQVAASRLVMEQVKMEATSLMGVAHCTRELLERSPSSFVALLDSSFREEFASNMMKERIRGTGVGQFQGALTLPTTGTSAVRIEVAKQTAGTGQAADTFVYENVIDMAARCWQYETRGVWLMNRDLLGQLPKMNLAVGDGGSAVFMPNAQGPVPMTLMNRPIVFSEYCSALGDAGDVICAAWDQFWEGTYQPLRSESSIFVRWVNHEESFKFWLENDGRWSWRSVFTPAYGATQSPVVTLAERA